jgi:hypothetical protein
VHTTFGYLTNYVFEHVKKIVKKYGILKELYKKKFNLFYLLSYEDKAHNIKVEINRRQFGSKYVMKTYLGVSMLVITPEDMFAHKLMAMTERIGRTSRDIYDVWFFLNKHFPINKEIVEKRAGKPLRSVMENCISQLEQMDNNTILSGVGELLTPSQKDWAKAKLRSETINLLKLRLDSDQ